MLKVSGVHTFYGSIEALRGVNLEVRAGEIVALIGANGAGKSTLLMTVCGQPAAARGRIDFDGEEITRWPTHAIIAAGIAQAPEGRRIFSRMSVRENLLMGGITADPRYRDEDLARVFALFPILAQRSDQRGGTLSGGEQQMLAIGRALMSRPRLLLLDEPSLGLAPMVVKQNLPDDRRNQQAAERYRLLGRAERLSRAEACASRLRTGQRPRQLVRDRPGDARQPGNSRRLSRRGALMTLVR